MASSLSSPTTLLLLLLLLLIFLHLGLSIPTSSAAQSHKAELASRRNLALMEEEEEEPPLKPPPKKKTTLETKNQTKLIKPKKTNSTTTTTITKIKVNKLNKTLTATPKASNSTKLPKLIKPIKSNSTKTLLKPLNSTTKPTKLQKKTMDLPLPKNKTTTSNPKPKTQPPVLIKATATVDKKKQQHPPPKKLDRSVAWLDNDDAADGGEDLITEFRDLPSRLLPDLEKLSISSKAYISRANWQIAEGVKPFVGHKYAPTIASIASGAFLLLPLLLLTLLFRHLRSYLSLQRALIFIQAYLAIYFATLALTAVATGLEPLRFFYAASPPSYACTQALQTLGYVLYLLAQLVHLVAAFSTSAAGDGGTRALALAQMVVGLAVGLHYYAVVFHRAVAGEPPRANWRIHAVYAACFLVICAFARAERRKKAYLPVAGDDVGKKS